MDRETLLRKDFEMRHFNGGLFKSEIKNLSRYGKDFILIDKLFERYIMRDIPNPSWRVGNKTSNPHRPQLLLTNYVSEYTGLNEEDAWKFIEDNFHYRRFINLIETETEVLAMQVIWKFMNK